MKAGAVIKCCGIIVEWVPKVRVLLFCTRSCVIWISAKGALGSDIEHLHPALDIEILVKSPGVIDDLSGRQLLAEDVFHDLEDAEGEREVDVFVVGAISGDQKFSFKIGILGLVGERYAETAVERGIAIALAQLLAFVARNLFGFLVAENLLEQRVILAHDHLQIVSNLLDATAASVGAIRKLFQCFHDADSVNQVGVGVAGQVDQVVELVFGGVDTDNDVPAARSQRLEFAEKCRDSLLDVLGHRAGLLD